jgi:hypothetical protein
MTSDNMREELIAPCGMNCALCSGYLAYKHNIKSDGIMMPYCSGCRPRNKKCAFVKKRCELLLYEKVDYCYECDDFPCQNLKALDKRYRTRFRMSMIENLEWIRDKGIAELLMQQTNTWMCPDCGGIICCHNGLCFGCGIEKLRLKEHKYSWEDK